MRRNLCIKRKSPFENSTKEFSILYIMLNYYEIAVQKVSDLNKIEFESIENENLKKDIVTSLKSDNDKNLLKSNILNKHKKLIEEVLENSSIQIILANKNNESITELLSELLREFEELKNQKK